MRAASDGALLDCTTAIIYLESAAGVEQGGPTGLVSISVAICFLLSLFVTPVIAVIPAVATTSALVMVGVFMMQGFSELDLRRDRGLNSSGNTSPNGADISKRRTRYRFHGQRCGIIGNGNDPHDGADCLSIVRSFILHYMFR
jgi:Permease family